MRAWQGTRMTRLLEWTDPSKVNLGYGEAIMEGITSFAAAELKILTDIKRCITSIRSLVASDVSSAREGVGVLQTLRQVAYEDVNQIQHEELVFRAARSLRDADFVNETLEWYWNPRQTGDVNEPDLQARNGGGVVLSAEVTTSERPDGVIDTRMRDTLAKLSTMQGRKFYFVRTDAMLRRAKTKVSGAGHPIEVRKI